MVCNFFHATCFNLPSQILARCSAIACTWFASAFASKNMLMLQVECMRPYIQRKKSARSLGSMPALYTDQNAIEMNTYPRMAVGPTSSKRVCHVSRQNMSEAPAAPHSSHVGFAVPVAPDQYRTARVA